MLAVASSEQDYTLSRKTPSQVSVTYPSLNGRRERAGCAANFGDHRNRLQDATYALAYNPVPLLVEPRRLIHRDLRETC